MTKSWSVTLEDLKIDQRSPGISGFMRLRNEEQFLDAAIASHLPGLDELVIVLNNCEDSTPEIAQSWQARFPEKIQIHDYDPVVWPPGSQESLDIANGAPESLANYYNYSLCLTSRQIVFKIDGDHIASPDRFKTCCGYVRKNLRRNERYPVYGINLVEVPEGLGVYNFYNLGNRIDGPKIGPTPLTDGETAFYYIDQKTWHVMDRAHGYEIMPLAHKIRHPGVDLTYLFFHMKGVKSDLGVGDWDRTSKGNIRQQWIDQVRELDPQNVASIAELAEHLPYHFRGVRFLHDVETNLPGYRLLSPGEDLPRKLDALDIAKTGLSRLRCAWRKLRYG
ncbi:MAG: hypothetical protein ACE363_07770 [Alphaproteobacteria bacterium]